MQIKNLTVIRKSYSGERKILNNINFIKDHDAADFIISEPGAGKTTLLETAAGLIRPSAGEIVLSKEIFLLLQIPERGFTSATCREEAGGDFASVGLPMDIGDISPWSLSRGEKKRLAFASILNYNAGARGSLILLDDPFTDLDISGIRLIIDKIEKVGFSPLIATNRENDPALFKERGIKVNIYRLSNGKLTKDK
ncbi:MAG: ATP-binding cassette domain-containing protein [Elusimicrobia bacterium]|nr:ATP-binding cassette domain-containing protein [Elusimicrobiota bacterium]